MGDLGEDSVAQGRGLYCKDYHRPKSSDIAGIVRNEYQRKSTCPAWASDPVLQNALLDGALVDTGGAKDAFGRPKKLWNAVDGFIFVGVSCNLKLPLYNCYPERPPDGKHFAELQRRAERTRDQILDRSEIGDG